MDGLVEIQGKIDGDAWGIFPWWSGKSLLQDPGPAPLPGMPERGGMYQPVKPVGQTASPSLKGQACAWPLKWVWLLKKNIVVDTIPNTDTLNKNIYTFVYNSTTSFFEKKDTLIEKL